MRERGEVQDYTNAFLGMTYPILVMSLVTVWGVWGYAPALAICATVHLLITRFGLRRAEAEADWDARVEAALSRARDR